MDEVFEETLRVLDGRVCKSDKVWWHCQEEPELVLAKEDWDNIMRYPEVYSLAEPIFQFGEYTGLFMQDSYQKFGGLVMDSYTFEHRFDLDKIQYGILHIGQNTLLKDFPSDDILVFDSYEDADTDPCIWNRDIYKVVKIKPIFKTVIEGYDVIE